MSHCGNGFILMASPNIINDKMKPKLISMLLVCVLVSVVVSGCTSTNGPGGGKKANELKVTCEDHISSKCDSGNLYWFDSCGNRQEIKQNCDDGCSNDACIMATSACTDECGQAGINQCTDSNHYKTCGNYDADGCLELSGITITP